MMFPLKYLLRTVLAGVDFISEESRWLLCIGDERLFGRQLQLEFLAHIGRDVCLYLLTLCLCTYDTDDEIICVSLVFEPAEALVHGVCTCCAECFFVQCLDFCLHGCYTGFVADFAAPPFQVVYASVQPANLLRPSALVAFVEALGILLHVLVELVKVDVGQYGADDSSCGTPISPYSQH